MLKVKHKTMWSLWIISTVVIAIYFSYMLFIDSEDKTVFLPGETSHGHYQIEMECSACHIESYTNEAEIQNACMNCHSEELKQVEDSHPKSKFTNPRNADRVAKLDARQCVTCHAEHKPEITGEMGVTVPEDVCIVCHQDIAEERPSHKGMEFTTCASAGCHNFHDNKALYEDFLLKHAGEKDILDTFVNKQTNIHERIQYTRNYPIKNYPIEKLGVDDKDIPASIKVDQKIIENWSATSHAESGVNCTACHNSKTDSGKVQWVDNPSQETCENCHDSESKGFLESKHGMRLAQGLSPMKPKLARLAMKSAAHDKELTCNTCHKPHRYDVTYAATESCLQCHNDKHSVAYKNSPHFKLWYAESVSGANHKKGVSCATCHMPRIEKQFPGGDKHAIVEHNQNNTLRPNEKMIRSVCMNCHGLEFSIDALADRDLIDNNFLGQPKDHIKSIDMAVERVKKK